MFHWFKKHNAEGLEKPDPTPIEVPLEKPLTLAQQIARFTKNTRIQQELKNAGMDTFDEADDFEVEEDAEINGIFGPTPYEMEFEGREMLPVQTRIDENRSGMVEEMPSERSKRAYERFKPKKQDKVPEQAQQA